jgi:chromatin remodeling complex protein RSC6
MPRTTKTVSSPSNATVEKAAPVKKVVKKVTKTKVKKAEPVVEPKSEVVEEPTTTTTTTTENPVEEVAKQPETEVKKETTEFNFEENAEETPVVKLGKRESAKEKIQKGFETLFELYKDELSVKKQPSQKHPLLKYINSLKTDVYRALKIKSPNAENRKNQKNSGFMKPVKISKELSEFLDASKLADEDITRVLITQKLCKYIKEKELQNPSDKREIIPDETFKKLFAIDNNEKLTFYSIQKKVQSHIYKC